MIDVFPFARYPVAVFGLGRSGLAAAEALVKSQAEVAAWDDNEDARARAAEAGVPLVDLYKCDWKEHTTLVLSPGIPLHLPEPHKIVQLAEAANVEVIGDVELLARAQREAAYIGVTGTNGKSTTTALIGHIMQVSGREAEIGGNLGVPALELDPMGNDGTYVLEMSSYQLELTKSITFDVAVLLNISPDHLDRHGGMDGYAAVKKSIFHRQTKPRTAVIGVDDPYCRAIYEELASTDEQVVIGVSGEQPVPGGVYAVNGVLIDDTDGQEAPVMDLKENPCLPGEHNWQNAAAAYAAAKSAGVQPHAVMACINSYPGLVHRQEPVEIVDGVGYVNDSKATNAEAAARALDCYDAIYWIAGGKPKDGGLKAVAGHLDGVRHAFLIGEASMEFSQFLDGKVPMTMSGDLTSAVAEAAKMAKADAASGASTPVVLLSPAAASFDQFESFEDRGDAFKDLVEALPGKHMDPFEEVGAFPGTARREGAEE
ncbi:MAG: UDP-N-acetylmuramoyl-L-alanine--D-glutamate ligase [Rhodospirillales bacterium]|nr:UDP-N-acetylmuramoyl-L-alanine--D-glutamate ligase [Alphaproteobacteria bacterium]MBL6947292.1 UDP-N-acetylmuramoyl-L-alanine--D-glutamate ligase [Rhodospirillales bacterium]